MDNSEAETDSSDEIPWEELFERADKTIQATIATLPPPIREQAEPLATLLEKWPHDEDDLLGQFHGFEADHISETLGPLFIFIGPLYEYCAEEKRDFEEEVRITYLHELGHHLGLDEDDLKKRGLG